MKPAIIKLSQLRQFDSFQSEEEGSQSSQLKTRRMLLLSLKKPTKFNKIDIKQLFEHDRKPIFSYSSHSESHNAEAQPSGRKTNEQQKTVQFNIRNLISRSVPHVLPQSRENSPSKRKTQKDFRINKEKMIKIVRNEKLQKMKQDFLNISEQLGMIANLREHHRPEGRETVKSRKNRTTYYINNFVKARYPRPLKESEKEDKLGRLKRERIQKIEIYPWQKQFQTEEDNFMQN